MQFQYETWRGVQFLSTLRRAMGGMQNFLCMSAARVLQHALDKEENKPTSPHPHTPNQTTTTTNEIDQKVSTLERCFAKNSSRDSLDLPLEQQAALRIGADDSSDEALAVYASFD